VFHIGEGSGDTVVDFAGNGAGTADLLNSVGYGVHQHRPHPLAGQFQ
jgi:hypothetical protein